MSVAHLVLVVIQSLHRVRAPKQQIPSSPKNLIPTYHLDHCVHEAVALRIPFQEEPLAISLEVYYE